MLKRLTAPNPCAVSRGIMAIVHRSINPLPLALAKLLNGIAWRLHSREGQ